ncbi:MAG: macro domain-containing protein [Acholeplasmatales bacterium]|jgi:O-acetyl-ADP-ribose deacetylase (regulator of RNase III)|nr:macro domain-containing protein [Acholeplasmatales bacterium]
MSLIFSKYSVFDENVCALVNTVNCVGFMGAGIALEFKLRYPKLFEDYKVKCEEKKIKIGYMDFYKVEDENNHILIVNFPTKFDYKKPSKMEWIEWGLDNFVRTYKNQNIKKIAFPILGTSNGGLNRDAVIELMHNKLRNLDGIDIIICEDKELKKDGIESQMIEHLDEVIKRITYLKSPQRETLNNLLASGVKRFRDIKGNGIGKITYEKIHNECYLAVINKKQAQPNLFTI